MEILKTIWQNTRKYSGLLIGLLIAGLTFITFGRKHTDAPVITPDADRDGKKDEEQVQEIKSQAEAARNAAVAHADAAVDAVNKPTAIPPSKTVQEAVQRNNEIDY